MKQKIVIKVSVNCEKCRKKAMKVAAVADGVMSVTFEGDEKNRLVVIGDGVDAACLTAALRKKACYASLEIVEEVKPPPPTGDDKDKKGKDIDEKPNPTPCAPLCPTICYQQPPFEMYEVVYDSYDPTPGCTIL